MRRGPKGISKGKLKINKLNRVFMGRDFKEGTRDKDFIVKERY